MNTLSIFMMAAAIGMGARIAQKAGFSPWWGVTQIIPLFGVIMIWVLAFVEWPGPRLPHGREEEKYIPPPE